MPIRLGLEPVDVMEALSGLDEEGISSFEPFSGKMLPNYETYRELLEGNRRVSTSDICVES
jgi:hypothetical protein